MKTELYLQIPKPCHENWDAMTPVDKGKFCASCSKEVVDFSLLSDAEVLNFFKRSTGNTCGRFNEDQLQRSFQETKIEKKKGWKWAMASIVSLIMVSRSNAQKKEDCTRLLGKVKVEQPKKPIAKEKDLTKIKGDTVIIPTIVLQPEIMGDVVIVSSGRKVKLEGIVVDEKNKPIVGTTIHTGNDAAIGFTDEKGRFNINTYTREKKLPVSFKSIGFIDDNAVIDLVKDEVELKVIMKSKLQVLPEVIVTSYGTSTRKGMVGSYVSYTKVTKKDTVATVVRKILDNAKIIENSLKIYPNPASKNSIIHLSIKDAGNYQVHLFDNTSRLLHAEENTTTVKQQSIDLPLPAGMSSGIHYVRIINMNTKKSYVEKLIVQR